jgi:hypothetical protein
VDDIYRPPGPPPIPASMLPPASLPPPTAATSVATTATAARSTPSRAAVLTDQARPAESDSATQNPCRDLQTALRRSPKQSTSLWPGPIELPGFKWFNLGDDFAQIHYLKQFGVPLEMAKWDLARYYRALRMLASAMPAVVRRRAGLE